VVALASDLEGIATSLIEAQAAGVAVVATRVGGIPEVVEDGVTGRLVPARDAQAMAAALIELLTDPEKARAMGARGSERAGEFHIDRTVDRTLEEYLAVTGRAPRAA
jgi:starch synthase